MAKLPTIRRLSREDYPEAPSWLDKLLFPLNSFLTSTYAALNNQLTINENMIGQTRTVTYVGGGAASFTWPFTTNPLGYQVINVTDSNGKNVILSSAPWLNASFSQGQVTIQNVTGLTSGVTYLVTVYVIGG